MLILRGALVLFTVSILPAQSPFQPIPPAISDSLSFRTPLADFEAKDIAGRTWRPADLQGRLTVIRIFAGWCLTCRAEAPLVQSLYDEMGANGKEKGYTFPVIANPELEQSLFPLEGGIPKTWVIDRQGRRSEPFRSWSFERIVLEVERLR